MKTFFACLLSIILVSQAYATKPIIGIQNSNPGNIRSENLKYWRSHGAVGLDPWKHLIFKTDSEGIRCIAFILKAYDRKGFRTIEQIVRRWVGPKNFRKAMFERFGYGQKLMQDTGLGPKDEVDFDDPETLLILVKAIVYAENGRDPYPDSLYRSALGIP